MGSTPKALRQPPPRRFENYVLTRVTSPLVNLVNIPDQLFSPAGAAGAGYADDPVSEPIDIGFDFQIDNIRYNKFVACSNGWMALVDPTTGTFSPSEVLDSSVWVNSAIKTTFTSKAVLLAPWFDDLRNMANDASQIVSTYGQTKVDRIKRGLEPPPAPVDEVAFAVKYYLDSRSPNGRRLIVRWNSLSDFSSPNTIIRFEAVLYENGTIEFRYTPRQNINLAISASTPEDATIGIFMPNGTNRWRDFSYGLGYRDTERQQYRYGGAVVTAAYSDTADSNTRSYTSNLKPFIHWPGLDGAGSMFTFAPPTNRRRVLPKLQSAQESSKLTLPTVARTGDTRLGNDPIMFDDRRTLMYVASQLSSASLSTVTASVLVNAPSMLQRFYGDSEPTVIARQDLFTGDFEFTASIVKGVIDALITDNPRRFIEPFSEYKLFENDPTSTSDPFFTTGSNISLIGDGLSQPLKAKTQIRLSLPVNNTCTPFGNTSSIYYFNTREFGWNIPQNSSYILPNGATTNTSGHPRGDLVQDVSNDSANRRILEDMRGFGPIGNMLSSGSHTPTTVSDQTDASIGAPYSVGNVTLALSKEYGKSITTSEDYRATADEVFKLPINQPFLIERAVIELPFAAGDGWFRDLTTCMVPLDNTPGAFDFAGPALTVALFNQTIVGSRSRRDLILSGTLTHYSDSIGNEIVFSAFPPISSTFQVRPRGFKAFGGVPGGVVTPTSSSTGGFTFTGSVAIKSEAQISNGVIVRLEMAMTGGSTQNNRQGVLDVFNTAEITLGNQTTPNYAQSTYIAYVNNFGRGGSGFDPSGRSVFGKEYASFQGLSAQGKIKNPFYISGTLGGASTSSYTGIPTQFSGAITNGTTFRFEAAVPMESYLPSPYLVLPTDTLILAVSKTRPVFYGSQTGGTKTSGSIRHDITLMTGTINIMLYGSMLREGKEFHDTLNQPLASDAIHEIVIGNEPILDQFETNYREAFISGSFDDFIGGDLITRITRPDGRTIFVTGSVIGSKNIANVLSRGSRGRIFSRTTARTTAPTPGTTEFDFTTSKAFAQQPYFEKVGSLRQQQAEDSTERFWDSLMPAINQCFLADGAGIFLLKNQGAFSSQNYIGDPRKVDQRIGFLWFDYQSPLWFPTWDKILDGVWTWAFPYEPRYSTIPRQQFIERSFLANYLVDFFGGYAGTPAIEAIPPTPLQGFFFGPVGSEFPSVPAIAPATTEAVPPGYDKWYRQGVQTSINFNTHDFHWICDTDTGAVNTFGFNLTSSAGVSDVVKALFGFGDLNNRMYSSLGPTFFGTTHFADTRRRDDDAYYNWGQKWSMSPIIRGWKYGVYSGLPTFSRAYFRQGSYGQVRDMLEQRPYTKFYQSSEKNPGIANFRQGTTPAAVTVKFVDAAGKLTKPENTWSQNLSFEATSSVPYFDGETRNRQPINTDTLNANIIAFKANQFGQVTL